MRFLILPMFLFSGTFFPLSQLPTWLQAVAWVSPLWHGVELCRSATTGPGARAVRSGAGPPVDPVAFIGVGFWWGTRTFARRLAT